MDDQWQNPPSNDPNNPVFEVVEIMPEFPDGGMSGLMQFLSKNIQYPINAQKTIRKVELQCNLSSIKMAQFLNPKSFVESIRIWMVKLYVLSV